MIFSLYVTEAVDSYEKTIADFKIARYPKLHGKDEMKYTWKYKIYTDTEVKQDSEGEITNIDVKLDWSFFSV